MINNNYRNWIADYFYHKKITLFWAASFIAIFGPWLLKGCAVSPDPTNLKISHKDCLVTKVYDGDTITVNCSGEKLKVRLYCIDAPEIKQAPYGIEARDYLRAQVAGEYVSIETKTKDRYGRTVAVVWRNSLNQNLALVRAGKAVDYPKYCNERAYEDAEESARLRKAGVWRIDGLQQKPWILRQLK